MTAFVQLKRNEGKIQRHEWVNLEAVDTFSGQDDGRTVVLLRSGQRIYVEESVPEILRLLGELVGDA